MPGLSFPYGHFIVPQPHGVAIELRDPYTSIINRLSHLPMEGDLFLPFFAASEMNAKNCGENVIEFAIFRKKFDAAAQLVLYDYEKILELAPKFAGYCEKIYGHQFPTVIENFYYSIISTDMGSPLHKRVCGNKKIFRLRRLEHLINLSVFPETEILPYLDQYKHVLRELYSEKKSATTLADLFLYNEKVESLLDSFTWKTQF
jgi:hypothetical protein